MIVLPDDGGSAEKASAHRERGGLLFFYKSTPPLPRWLFSLFRYVIAFIELRSLDGWIRNDMEIVYPEGN